MKKFTKKDQKLLALWAADCAEHVLPYFEKEFPKDDRPRKAIEACRIWVRTGVFKMALIRGASLAAHAAARATLKASARQARKALEDRPSSFCRSRGRSSGGNRACSDSRSRRGLVWRQSRQSRRRRRGTRMAI